MLIYNNKDIVSFSLFSQFPELTCLMSTRNAGDLRIRDKNSTDNNEFLKSQTIPSRNFVAMEQRHGVDIVTVNSANGGQVIPHIDGLVTKDQTLYLGVNTADCVPLFYYDPAGQLIGVAHAGWQGTFGNLAMRMVTKLEDLGSDPLNMRVAIGPHIGGCCYTVNAGRAMLFRKTFQDERIAYQADGNWHIDLGMANKNQLIESGVLETHIDSPITCTSCQNDLYFSFRKDTEATFGEMLGIIGMKTKNV